jgi:hypothetical protein
MGQSTANLQLFMIGEVRCDIRTCSHGEQVVFAERHAWQRPADLALPQGRHLVGAQEVTGGAEVHDLAGTPGVVGRLHRELADVTSGHEESCPEPKSINQFNKKNAARLQINMLAVP